MPSCWFVLLRYWLRVDGVTIRLRDTRCFHAFGKSTVVREHSLKEAPCPQPAFATFPSKPAPVAYAYWISFFHMLRFCACTVMESEMTMLPGRPGPAASRLPVDMHHPAQPPRIKVIKTPEEAAQMLQHHPKQEESYELLRLDKLLTAGGPGSASSGSEVTDAQPVEVHELCALEETSPLCLDDWIECCAAEPESGLVALGSSDGEILLLKSETAVRTCRFLGHGDADLNFEAATMSLRFSPVARPDADGHGGAMLVSTGEDGTLRVWSADMPLERGGVPASLCCEVRGLDGEGADYRRRGSGPASTRVACVQLVACAPSVEWGVDDQGPEARSVPDLAVAVGRAVVLVGLDASWRSHKGNVRLGCVHSTVTALEFSVLPSLGVSLLAACYGAVSVWGAAALQGGAGAPPTRTLEYKGPLLGLCVSQRGSLVCAGCQDGTMHVWKLDAVGATPAAPDGIEGAGGRTDTSAVQPKTPKPAKATVSEVSCGGYDEKVVCHEWSAAGKFAPGRLSGAPTCQLKIAQATFWPAPAASMRLCGILATARSFL